MMQNLIKPNLQKPEQIFLADRFAVVDIETTGLDPLQESIVEIACVLVAKDRIIGEFSLLMNPNRSIPDEVSQIHGIFDEDVAYACSVDEVLAKFEFFIGNLPLLAHNATFDFGFIQQALGYELPNLLYDSVALARRLLPWQAQYGLKALCTQFQIDNERAHRALSDCRATAQVVLALKKLKEQPNLKAEEILYQVVENNTYAIREQLKKAGFRWYKEHQIWGILLAKSELLEEQGEMSIRGFRCKPYSDSSLSLL
jgi:DNA polymerase III epsilon subunit family exonuclease